MWEIILQRERSREPWESAVHTTEEIVSGAGIVDLNTSVTIVANQATISWSVMPRKKGLNSQEMQNKINRKCY